MLGGDHTTTLSALRAAYGSWGKVAVVHFDAHIGMCPVPVMRGIGGEERRDWADGGQIRGIRRCWGEIFRIMRTVTPFLGA